MSTQQPGINRRTFAIGAGGALATAAGLPAFSRAQESTPAPEAVHYDVTGWVQQFTIGDFQCSAISDGSSLNNDPNDPLYFYNLAFGLSPTEEVHAALNAGGYDVNRLIRQDTCLLVDTGDHLVLVDTGFGPAFGGALLSNLEHAGVSPEEIDVVATTHGHIDHIGGNADENGAPVFLNARYVMPEVEWNFWTDNTRVEEAVPNEAIREIVLAFVQSQMLPLADQYELIGYNTEIVPGVTSIESRGHTPGHMSVGFQSGEERLVFAADFATHPVDMPHPSFTGFSDTDPEEAVATRRRLFQQLADDNSQVLFGHFDPFPGLGHVAADGDTWKWTPVPNEV